ncbi:MAG: Gfo/Idh/MocA family oxidoreductase [Anaerolineales bacterium]|nr:Gfo/Idh/MocA family oxidoreductase [Anaerolineales bacterium]
MFRGRFEFRHCLPEFAWDNQPLLKKLERLVLADQGSHQFDLARFFFGEFKSIYAQHLRVRDDIAGEDVATALLRSPQAIVTVHITFVTKTEERHFPETMFYLEGNRGTLELKPDFWLHVTTAAGTWVTQVEPPRYPWADPAYDVNHASMVPLHQDFLKALRTGAPPENTGEDNLKTMQLVYAAYESAAHNQVISLSAE